MEGRVFPYINTCTKIEFYVLEMYVKSALSLNPLLSHYSANPKRHNTGGEKKLSRCSVCGCVCVSLSQVVLDSSSSLTLSLMRMKPVWRPQGTGVGRASYQPREGSQVKQTRVPVTEVSTSHTSWARHRTLRHHRNLQRNTGSDCIIYNTVQATLPTLQCWCSAVVSDSKPAVLLLLLLREPTMKDTIVGYL